MNKHTIVIDFTGVQEPAYGAGMVVLGGKVVAVAFADEMERAEQLESQRDDLLEALEKAEAKLCMAEHMLDLREDDSPSFEPEILAARAAIARARGEA